MTDIPRVIHQMWLIDGPPIPGIYADWVDEWQGLHPDWEHKLWVAPPAMTPANTGMYHLADFISPTAPEQFRSDIARYEILYQFGGVWVDVDFEPQRPIDDLCDTEAFVAWEVQDRWASNAIMGAVPNHPFIGDLAAGLKASVDRNRGESNTKMTGPQYLTPVLRDHPEVDVYPQWMFFPYPYNRLGLGRRHYPDAYAVHHWGNQRRKRKAPL